jgi:hypothetical protein
MVERRGLDTGRCLMKAIVVRDEAAGTAEMTLVERPEPEPAITRSLFRFMRRDSPRVS